MVAPVDALAPAIVVVVLRMRMPILLRYVEIKAGNKKGCVLCVKTRPFLTKFLKTCSQNFDLYLYTAGALTYGADPPFMLPPALLIKC
jgi:hypothetical protein